MRFMVLLKGEGEAGAQPSAKLIGAMLKYNEELVNAGVLLGGEGLHHSSTGARVVVTDDGKRTVVDGPFTETKELVAGFWLLQVRSRDEALEWAKRAPVEHALGDDNQEAVLEVRQVVEAADLTEATDAQLTKEEELRGRVSGG
jgi:hypothetical protein